VVHGATFLAFLSVEADSWK